MASSSSRVGAVVSQQSAPRCKLQPCTFFYSQLQSVEWQNSRQAISFFLLSTGMWGNILQPVPHLCVTKPCVYYQKLPTATETANLVVEHDFIFSDLCTLQLNPRLQPGLRVITLQCLSVGSWISVIWTEASNMSSIRKDMAPRRGLGIPAHWCRNPHSFWTSTHRIGTGESSGPLLASQ